METLMIIMLGAILLVVVVGIFVLFKNKNSNTSIQDSPSSVIEANAALKAKIAELDKLETANQVLQTKAAADSQAIGGLNARIKALEDQINSAGQTKEIEIKKALEQAKRDQDHLIKQANDKAALDLAQQQAKADQNRAGIVATADALSVKVDTLTAQIKALNDQHKTQTEELKQAHQTTIDELKTSKEAALSTQKETAKTREDQLAKLMQEQALAAKAQIDTSKASNEEAVATTKAYLSDLKEQHAKQFQDQARRHTEELAHQHKLREEILAQMEAIKKQVTDAFMSATKEAMDQNETTFLAKAQSGLLQALLPVNELKAKVEEQMTLNNQHKGAFDEQIKALKDSTERIHLDAQNLTDALKGNKKIQGNWGEIQLIQLLEHSGLKNGVNYEAQAAHKNEDGENQFFDVKVLLPGNKSIIIDAKVSLNNYIDAQNADTDELTTIKLNQYVKDLRKHVDGLSGKNYTAAKGVNTVEYVLLFVPLEMAFMVACNHDTTLWRYGYDKKVIIVTPSTLMATLLAIKTVWNQEDRNRNAEKIGEITKAIADKIHGFLDTFEKVGAHLQKATDAFSGAKGQLTTGSGNVVKRLDQLANLGIVTKKRLNKATNAIDDEDDEDQPDLSLNQPITI